MPNGATETRATTQHLLDQATVLSTESKSKQNLIHLRSPFQPLQGVPLWAKPQWVWGNPELWFMRASAQGMSIGRRAEGHTPGRQLLHPHLLDPEKPGLLVPLARQPCFQLGHEARSKGSPLNFTLCLLFRFCFRIYYMQMHTDYKPILYILYTIHILYI